MRLARMCRKAFNLLIGMLAVAAVFFGCGNQNPTTETYPLAVGTLVPSVTELAPTAVWPSVTPTAMRAEPTPTGVTGPSATVTAIPGSIPVGHEPVQAQTATVAQTVIPSSAENDTYSAWPDHTVTPTVSPTPLALADPSVTSTVRPTPTPSIQASPTPPTTFSPSLPDVSPTQIFISLQELTQRYSPRESGTHEELEAALHLEERLKGLDFETSIQEFSFEHTVADIEVVSAFNIDPIAPRAIPIVGSVKGEASGLLVDVNRAYQEDIPEDGLEGQIALMKLGGGITVTEKTERVAAAGAVGAIIANYEPGLFHAWLPVQSEIPAAAVGLEAHRTITWVMLEHGDLNASISVHDATKKSQNIIADRSVAMNGDRTVIVGAHYDTVPETDGASDNGSGVSALLAIAQHVAGTDYPFNVRVILFGAEEPGLFGSRHYVGTLTSPELEDTIAMLNFDSLGSGERLGRSGSDGLVDRAGQLAKELGKRVDHYVDLPLNSDHAPFMEVGVPALRILSNNQDNINAPRDVMRHINPDLLGSAVELGIGMLDLLAFTNDERSE